MNTVKCTKFVLLIAAVTVLIEANKLPSYIKTCKKTDPNLNECFVNNANLAFPELFKGDPNLGTTQYKPYILPELDLGAGEDLNYHITNAIIFIPFDTALRSAKVDFKEKSIDFVMFARQVSWLVDYVATGSIRGKTVNEKGQGYIVMYDVEISVTSKFDRKIIDGKEHIEIQSAQMGTSSKFFEFTRYNTKQMGPVLNEEEYKIFIETSKKIILSIRDKMKELGSVEALTTMNKFFQLAPENEIFP